LRAINRIHSQNVKKQNLNRDHVVANTADPEHIGVPQRFFSVVFHFISSLTLAKFKNGNSIWKYSGSINQYNSSSNSITKEIPSFGSISPKMNFIKMVIHFIHFGPFEKSHSFSMFTPKSAVESSNKKITKFTQRIQSQYVTFTLIPFHFGKTQSFRVRSKFNSKFEVNPKGLESLHGQISSHHHGDSRYHHMSADTISFSLSHFICVRIKGVIRRAVDHSQALIHLSRRRFISSRSIH